VSAFVLRASSCSDRSEKSCQSVELIVPSGFIANEPLPMLWPVSVAPTTEPSLAAVAALPVVAISVVLW
jgi:hypothetical protein